MNASFSDMFKWFNMSIFHIGETPVTVAGISIGFCIIFGAFLVSCVVQRVVTKQLAKKVKLSHSAAYSLRRIINYVFISIGVVIASESIGLKFSSLAVTFGFLGVGIGFGLQNITSNFISGIILLIERPIGVGDLVNIDDKIAEVISIDMRSTTVKTFDNIMIIVPNSRFIEKEVVNWTVGDPRIRLHCPVGVSYDTNEQLVKEVLLKVAKEHKDVLQRPAPEVRFLEFADSSLNFDLLIWTEDPRNQRGLRSDINFAIAKAFRENNIKIPYPQQDIHLQMTPAIEKLATRLPKE